MLDVWIKNSINNEIVLIFFYIVVRKNYENIVFTITGVTNIDALRKHLWESIYPMEIIIMRFQFFRMFFLYLKTDGTDGKQARRTNSSSPLGELFDHGLDSWASMFMPVAIYSIFGRGEFGVGVYRTYFVVLGVNFCFILSHWEKYNTKVLYLPWGYDIGLLVSEYK